MLDAVVQSQLLESHEQAGFNSVSYEFDPHVDSGLATMALKSNIVTVSGFTNTVNVGSIIEIDGADVGGRTLTSVVEFIKDNVIRVGRKSRLPVTNAACTIRAVATGKVTAREHSGGSTFNVITNQRYTPRIHGRGFSFELVGFRTFRSIAAKFTPLSKE